MAGVCAKKDEYFKILLLHGGDASHIPLNKDELLDAGFDYIARGILIIRRFTFGIWLSMPERRSRSAQRIRGNMDMCSVRCRERRYIFLLWRWKDVAIWRKQLK